MTRPLPHLTGSQARALVVDTEPWLSCEECFEAMDRHVERLLGRTREAPEPGLQQHLAGCAACAEEVESLLELARQDDVHGW